MTVTWMSRYSATTIGKGKNDADRFKLAVSQIAGKRLTYAELTGKVGETSPALTSQLDEATEPGEAEEVDRFPFSLP